MDGSDVLGGMLGVAAVATSLYVTYERQQERAAAAARHAASGWAISELAREMTAGYDKWSDGSFDITPFLGIRSLGEDVRTERTSRRDAVWGARYSGAAYVTTTNTTTYTITPMLTVADANHDGTVTMLEIENLLRGFDVDKDGRISAAERASAYARYGEVVDGRSSRATKVDLPAGMSGQRSQGSETSPVIGREPLPPQRAEHVDVGGRHGVVEAMRRQAQAIVDARNRESSSAH